ncbi:MAG: radical SAM family heme chaperone HemW [Henriciella sp.]
MTPTGPHYGFGLYIHWPYCAKICPYCDFNVYAAKEHDTRPLVDAIRRDIAGHADHLTGHPPLDSVFFGGGTPSLLSAVDIGDIIETAAARIGVKPGAEMTIEANPSDIQQSDLSGWANAGINRVSLGIQSLRDDALSFLGRDHTAAGARAALEAIQTQFENHSIDLIYARPDQSLKEWETELDAALALGAPHLSLYELTIEARTAFGKRAARGELKPMPDETQADLYELTQTLCEASGLPAYEVSNHTRSETFQSVHNAIYWNSGDWIGVGPGAHGRLTVDGQRCAVEAARRPADYIAQTGSEWVPLTQEETALEVLAMGLRPASGLDTTRYEELTGTKLPEHVMSSLVESGHLTQSGSHIALTKAGRLLADHIAAQLAV